MKMDQTYTMPVGLDQPKKSGHNLVKLGLILFCVSLCVCVNSITIGFISEEWTSPLVTLCCSLVFFCISLLSMYGESGENQHEKRILFACVGFTIIGFAAMVIGSVFNINSWNRLNAQCNIHQENPLRDNTTFENAYDSNNITFSDIIYDDTTMENVTFETNDTILYDSIDTIQNDTVSLSNSTDIVEITEISWFCHDRRIGLFLLMVSLLICNELISIVLSYVIVVTRIRQSNYVSAVAV